LPWRGISDGRPGDGGGDEAIKKSDDKSPFLGLRPGESDEVEDVEDVEDTERLFRLSFFSMVSALIMRTDGKNTELVPV
jgi:hypothetical protein